MDLLTLLQTELSGWEPHQDGDAYAWSAADWRYVQVKRDVASNAWEFRLHADVRSPATTQISVVNSNFTLDGQLSTAAACRQRLERFIQ